MSKKQQPTIETERLRLRSIRFSDAEDVFAYTHNPNVLRYTTGRTPQVLGETQNFIKGLVEKPEGAFAFAICLKKDSRLVGIIEFGIEDGTNGAIDYSLAEEYWNRGIMTEAAGAVLAWGFRNHTDLQIVSASAMTVNKGSIRVMEKCGMKYKKQEQAKWEKFEVLVKLIVYYISRKMWNNQQRGIRRNKTPS